MQSILEELYHGNIRPDSRFYGKDSPFVKAACIKHDSMEKLKVMLSDSEIELFEKYCDAQGEIDSIVKYDTFTYALKFGILLMVEIFADRSEAESARGGCEE